MASAVGWLARRRKKERNIQTYKESNRTAISFLLTPGSVAVVRHSPEVVRLDRLLGALVSRATHLEVGVFVPLPAASVKARDDGVKPKDRERERERERESIHPQ